MRTRSQSRHNSPQQEASPVIVEPLQIELPFLEDQFQEDPPPEVLMADNQTMAELLQAPIEGYEDAIVIPKIAANNFELKHGLINLVQNKQFFGHDKEDPHAHIRHINKITSTMRFFPPSKTTNLRNEITRFQKRFDGSFYEAWDRFNDLLRACPHHGFSELHQLDTFYIALNSKSKVRQLRAKADIAKVSTSSSTPAISSDVVELKDKVKALLLDKKNQSSAPAPSHTPALVKAVEPNYVTCGGTHSYQKCPATSGNAYQDNIQEYVSQAAAVNYNQGNIVSDIRWLQIKFDLPVSLPIKIVITISIRGTILIKAKVVISTNLISIKANFIDPSYVKANDAVLRNMQNQGQNLQIQLANLTDMLSKFMSSNTASSSGLGTLPSNTITNPKEELKGITTRSDVTYQGPTIPTPAPMPNVKSSIPYPSRHDNERHRDQANEQIKKFYEIFKDMSFEITFSDALILMPKFASTLKALIGNKEKLSEMARTLMNEHCSAIILNKLPRKLRDPGKFLIPCEFPGMDECLAFADLGASVNLMPLSIWEALSLPELTLTCMTLELADHSVSKPIGVAKDVSFKVGMFHFPANFVVIEFEPDPQVPLILGRCFLKTDRALIDVHKGELTLCIRNEAITYNLDQTVLKSHKRAIAWKLSDIRSIKPEFCTYEILMEEDYKPAVQHQRRVNTKIHDVTKKEVEKLLDAGLIYPISDSPWVSPIHCVPKKGGFTVIKNEENELIPTCLVTGWRVCIDYQKLNEATYKDHFPLSFMDQMLERLAGNEFYCFLDGFSGYFQIPIDPCDQEKTTFTCPYRMFAYRRMPFGLCNAPGTFQRCMLAIFHDLVEKTMEVFMDDFSVFGNSFENYFSHLDKMLQRCKDTNLSLNWEKSHFMVKEGIVLGHKISKNEIKVDRAKVDVIAKLPHPVTVKDCIKAFQTLKKKLTKALIFELMCDASDFAIGAVLGQRHEKHFKPIHYASKTMNDAKSNYTTTEKEMLAVVYAFKNFRSYLIMNKSIVHTDHSALKYLFAKIDAKARLLQWVLLLQEFNFKVLDTKGVENLAANHLS
nr:reverse transcriptase domain-containing protein [Tanacetum cinerariifolium]